MLLMLLYFFHFQYIVMFFLKSMMTWGGVTIE